MNKPTKELKQKMYQCRYCVMWSPIKCEVTLKNARFFGHFQANNST